ncbi:MAG TPA: retropepsin-like aspartic protease [Rhizomicrobium sp.]|nr:retropepsin-like aspartic protease [Rhizomicrobium sp.]
MRILMSAVLLAALLPSAAQAADCKLQIIDIIHMDPAFEGLEERIPVKINGVQKSFIFDTGGSLTQVARAMAEDLKLPVRQGNIQMYDVAGNISRDQAAIHEFMIGHMRGTDVNLPVNPGGLPADGIVALDYLHTFDADVDFTSNTLRIFSQDHCPGQVVYWTSPANVGIVPITMNGYHMIVPVTLDGKPERAVIDTGATFSTITIPEAHRLFDLTPGTADVPEYGKFNNDPTLKTYSHDFKSLSIGDIAVTNPKLILIPNAMGRNADRSQYVGDRTKSDKTEINVDDMIIGMDVLRKLHIYIAFGERKMYVSGTSAPPVSTAPAAPATAQ